MILVLCLVTVNNGHLLKKIYISLVQATLNYRPININSHINTLSLAIYPLSLLHDL